MANLELVDRIITALGDKKLSISIFMDLSKAFDTLNHEILLCKLQYYGKSGVALDWFNNYLTDRTQYIALDHITRTNVNETLNSELSEVHDWLTLNKLTLNMTKTKFMAFHPTQKDITELIPTLEINGVEIERVSEFKNLGVIKDENLSWKSHTNISSKKMSKYADILNKLKKHLCMSRDHCTSAWLDQP